MSRKRNVSRRAFIGSSAVVAAAPMIVPSTVFGANAPSNRIGVGMIGVGSRGTQHTKTMMNNGGVQIIAVCDAQTANHEKAKRLVEGAYAAQMKSGEYKGCAATADFRDIIARDDIDAVVIAAPENWHGVMASMAAQAGKDIYGEKSLTHTVAEGNALIDVIRRHGTVFQAGTQQRSGANFRQACELARNGYLGEVKEIHVGVPGGKDRGPAGVWPSGDAPSNIDYDLWLGPAPWKPYREGLCSFNWYFVYDYCVGWVASWGVHHMDIALWGMPCLHEGKIKVDGTAEFFQGSADVSHTWDVTIRTQGGVRCHFVDNTKSHGQGCRFIGDKGWVHVKRGGIAASDPALLKLNLRPDDERLQVSQGSHMQDFLTSVATRRDPVAPVEACHRATTMTIVADIATRLKREVVWDWDKERFDHDETANRMLSRSLRAPWRV